MKMLDHIHRFVPGTAGTDAPTLLLLHGTGGNEDSLLEVGRALHLGAALLSPRGQILENGMPRFFRRLAEGVFDEADLVRRTGALADFVREAASVYGFDPGHVVAVGYSNGANIAASTLLLRPETLSGAVLWRAMVPLRPAALPGLGGVPVLLASGRRDPLVPVGEVEELAALLGRAGAKVTLRWSDGGHALGSPEVMEAAEWVRGRFPGGESEE